MLHLSRRHSLVLTAAALALTLAAPARADDPQLIVMDWPGFDAAGLSATFTEKWGAAPQYVFVTSDDDTFQKVSSGLKADVLHPCSQMVPKYREAGLIVPWDAAKIPELANISPAFLASPVIKDDGGVWMIPTDWGVTAVAYNSEKVPAEDVASLQVFADPKYQGKIALPDAADDVWALAYLATGVTDWTNVTDAQFAAAADWLRAVNKNVRAYFPASTEMAEMMKSGDVLIAWSWPDGINYLRKDGFPLGYQRTPTEGITTWFCGMVHLKDGPAGDEKAHDYVNSWIRPEAASVLFNEIGYGHANQAGMAAIDLSAREAAGLTEVTGPSLPQLPIGGTQREAQVQEFEKIKAGF